jgi:hypothetical protein
MLFVDLEAQPGPGEGLQPALPVRDDGLDDALPELGDPRRLFQWILQRQESSGSAR